MPELSSYTIENFAGGLADEGKRGVPGAFRNGFNLNIHKKGKNTLSCNQKLKKISPNSGGHEVVDLIIKIVPVSVTKSYGFGDNGKIYLISGETVTLKYTDPDGEILDAEYFYGYLYWTTKTNVKRHLETTATWNVGNSAVITPDSGSFNECDYHPIFIVPKSDLMCIGNERYVSTISAANYFNAEALDLFYGWVVKCLTLIKPKLLIGAKDHKKAEMFDWDLTSDSYDPVEGWEERDIIAFLKAVGSTYIFTPETFYWFREGLVDVAKELPSEIKPGAIDIWKRKILFGATNGVYSYHKKNKNYPLALNLEYTPSPITIANFDSKSIDIGAVLGRGDDLLVAWKDGATYGLDNIDTSNKAAAVYEGMVFDASRSFEDKLFKFIKIVTNPLPEDCSIKAKYKMNETGEWVKAYQADESEAFDKDDHKEGTVEVTQNSKTVTGTGTGWDSSMVGRKFRVDTDGDVYIIEAVASAISLTLTREYQGTTGSGKDYTILGETKVLFQIEGQGEVYEVRVELYPNGNDTPEIISINSYFEGSNIY